jgi:hypothetical protein
MVGPVADRRPFGNIIVFLILEVRRSLYPALTLDCICVWNAEFNSWDTEQPIGQLSQSKFPDPVLTDQGVGYGSYSSVMLEHSKLREYPVIPYIE